MVSSHLKIELCAALEDRQTGGVVVHGAREESGVNGRWV